MSTFRGKSIGRSALILALLTTLAISACSDSSSQETTTSESITQESSEEIPDSDAVISSEADAESESNAEATPTATANSPGESVCAAVEAIESPPLVFEVSLSGDVEQNLAYLTDNRARVDELATTLDSLGDSFTSDERRQFLILGPQIFLLQRAMDRWQRALEAYESGDPGYDGLEVDEFGARVVEQVLIVRDSCP